MRMHIELDDELAGRVDEVAGPRGRSAFVRAAVEEALDRETRRRAFEATAGSLRGQHDWDADPAAWVREQRRTDPRRAG